MATDPTAPRTGGASALGWLGALPQAAAFQRRPVATLHAHARSGHDPFELATLMAGPAIVVGTPELAYEVMHAAPGLYMAGAANRRILPVLPEGTILTLDGAEHRARRSALAPLFHGDSLSAMRPIIREIARAEIDSWPAGKPFEVLPRMRFMTLCIAARLILGVEGKPLVGDLERHLSRALHPYTMLAGIDALARLGPVSPQAMARRCRAGFARGLADVRAARPDAPRGGPADAVDALCVAAAGEDRLGEQEIADELFALLLAGHETTATAVAWAVEVLAREPATTAALAEEAAVEGRSPLMDAVISELLRFRPPLMDIVRQIAEPTRLGGHDLTAQALVLITPPLIHQHVQPTPETFIPERFRDSRPDPLTWLPFGGGERRCLGASLALLELREILSLILTRFELRPTREHPEEARLHGTALIPARGARIVLQPR